MTLWVLRGSTSWCDYEITNNSIRNLQIILTKILRAGGSGFIYRVQHESINKEIKITTEDLK